MSSFPRSTSHLPFTGKTRFDRLYLIGTSSIPLSSEALKSAIAEAKQGKDVGKYDAAVSALREISPDDPNAKPDLSWIEKTSKQVKVETDRLETELKGYKNNLIKESIRVSCAVHHPAASVLTGAFRWDMTTWANITTALETCRAR